MKYYFIINPASGRVAKEDIEGKIGNACNVRGIEYEVLYTEKPGQAGELAANVKCEDEHVIFSVGGDGNLFDVVNGVAGTDKVVGVIPLGSGNDFYRTLSKQPIGVISSDLGTINGKYFINIACIGLDADIANNLDIMKKKKWIPVSQRYTASILYTFLKYKFKNLNIKFGQEEKQSEYTIVTICNGQFYGGGYRIAPHAMLDDGFFEIYLVDKMPKVCIPKLITQLKMVKHENSKRVVRYTDSEVTISSEQELACNIDGEVLRGNELNIKIQKNAIKLYNDPKFVSEIV